MCVRVRVCVWCTRENKIIAPKKPQCTVQCGKCSRKTFWRIINVLSNALAESLTLGVCVCGMEIYKHTYIPIYINIYACVIFSVVSKIARPLVLCVLNKTSLASTMHCRVPQRRRHKIVWSLAKFV